MNDPHALAHQHGLSFGALATLVQQHRPGEIYRLILAVLQEHETALQDRETALQACEQRAQEQARAPVPVVTVDCETLQQRVKIAEERALTLLDARDHWMRRAQELEAKLEPVRRR